MINYYFTFGSTHWPTDNIHMMDRWVTVVAKDYTTSRKIFVERFTSKRMEKDYSFLSQYTEEDFAPQFFPEGEFAKLYQHG